MKSKRKISINSEGFWKAIEDFAGRDEDMEKNRKFIIAMIVAFSAIGLFFIFNGIRQMI